MNAQLDIFFNTSHESGEVLAKRRANNGQQNNRILAAMQVLESATPSKVHAFLGPKFLIGSVRRAMTTLAKAGKLEKTSTQVPGPHGVPEYVWRIIKTPAHGQDHQTQVPQAASR